MSREETLLFKTIFDQTPVSTQIFSPDGETIMVNKAWETLWNISFAKLKSYNILKDKQLVEEGIMPIIKRAFRGESVFLPAIKYVPSKSVSVKGAVPFRWLQAKMYPIRNSKGSITHLVLQHEDITQRKEAGEATNRLAAIIEYSDDAIISKTLDGIITSWNKGAELLFGYKAKEAVGKHITLIIPKDLRSEEMQIISNLKKGLQIDHFETERVGKNGKKLQVSLSVSPVKDDQGTIVGASKIARDISDKSKHEEALRMSEQRFRILTSHAPVGIFMTDKDGNCLFVNARWSELAGMTQKQALGSGWINALHPDDRDRVSKAWYDAAQKKIEFSMDYRFMNKKGEITWLKGTAVGLPDELGRVTGYMGTITDITEIKDYEISLQDSEERLRLALQAGKIGVWDWDLQNDSLVWTENVYVIHGVTEKDFRVTVDNFRALIHQDDSQIMQDALQKSIQEKKPFSAEFRIVTPAGEIRWVTTSAVTMTDEHGNVTRLLGATTDVTRQKQIEQDKSDFLSMASHELKTPLTSMKIFIDLLRSQLDEKNQEKPVYYINRIADQANRLTELTSDLLDVSRIETGKLKMTLEVFNLEALVTDTIESLQPSTTVHKIILEKQTKALINADRYRLYQVLINLLTNAIKYSPRGKDIIVRIEKEKKDVIVSVQDFGIGIKKDQQEKIFERLYQVTDPAEKTYPGLGLGLYISKEIVERHNGRIWVSSTKGEGSTFYFSVPLQSAAGKKQ